MGIVCARIQGRGEGLLMIVCWVSAGYCIGQSEENIR